jgi:hypothetical protein
MTPRSVFSKIWVEAQIPESPTPRPKTQLVESQFISDRGTLQGDGPWRYALTRPAAGGKGPFNALRGAEWKI